jgi:hypothetical protein
MTEKNLISLKEAAKESGYSADYIGQLIRAGKIPGKQVYTNISWMTTAQAVLDYKNTSKANQKNLGVGGKMLRSRRKLMMEVGIIKLVFQNFKSAIPLLIIIFTIFTALLYSIFYFSSNNIIEKKNIESSIDNNLSF